MMAERGLSLAHTTIMRWVWRYAPEFEKRWKRFAQAVGRSWRVDETYVKIRGEWGYLYRAAGSGGADGSTSELERQARDYSRPPRRFFGKAIKGQHDAPRTITLDGYAASHRAVRELKADGLLPAEDEAAVVEKYLNNLIEQDHRGVKQQIATMLGFKVLPRIRGDYDRRYRIDASHPQRDNSDWDVWVSKVDFCACSVECRAPSLKSRQHNTGRFPAPAICTRAAAFSLTPNSPIMPMRSRSLSATRRLSTSSTHWNTRTPRARSIIAGMRRVSSVAPTKGSLIT